MTHDPVQLSPFQPEAHQDPRSWERLHGQERILDPSQIAYGPEEIGISPGDDTYEVSVIGEIALPSEGKSSDNAAILAITRKSDGAQRFTIQGLKTDEAGKSVANGHQAIEITDTARVLGRTGDKPAKRTNEVPAAFLWGVNKTYGSHTSGRHLELRVTDGKVALKDMSTNGTMVAVGKSEIASMTVPELIRSEHVPKVSAVAGGAAVGGTVEVSPDVREAADADIKTAEAGVDALIKAGKHQAVGNLMSELIRYGDMDEKSIGDLLRRVHISTKEMSDSGKKSAGIADFAERIQSIVAAENRAHRYTGEIRGANTYEVRDLAADLVKAAGADLDGRSRWHEEKASRSEPTIDSQNVRVILNDGVYAAMNNVSTMNGQPVAAYINQKLKAQ